MKASTAGPALTSNITRRGRFRREQNSSIEWAPTMDFPVINADLRISVPLASFSMKWSTLETVRLNAATVNPDINMNSMTERTMICNIEDELGC